MDRNQKEGNTRNINIRSHLQTRNSTKGEKRTVQEMPVFDGT